MEEEEEEEERRRYLVFPSLSDEGRRGLDDRKEGAEEQQTEKEKKSTLEKEGRGGKVEVGRRGDAVLQSACL